MDTVLGFERISDIPALLRCGTCGAVVDASEHGRALHRSWHASLPVDVDLPALEAEHALNIA
jgi:hypothetical protein